MTRLRRRSAAAVVSSLFHGFEDGGVHLRKIAGGTRAQYFVGALQRFGAFVEVLAQRLADRARQELQSAGAVVWAVHAQKLNPQTPQQRPERGVFFGGVEAAAVSPALWPRASAAIGT